jgi:hypothetical protein
VGVTIPNFSAVAVAGGGELASGDGVWHDTSENRTATSRIERMEDLPCGA